MATFVDAACRRRYCRRLGAIEGFVVVRWSAVVAVSLCLAACSGDAAGRKVIVDACLRNGQQPGVCACLASESEKRLDKPMFQLVVLGAQGNASETDRIMATLTPQASQKFAATTDAIKKTCKLEGEPIR